MYYPLSHASNLHSSQSLLGDHIKSDKIMKISLVQLLAGLALIICSCPSGQGVYLVSPSFSQLIKSGRTPMDMKNTILKIYHLEMNSEFWTRYKNLTRSCLKINSFWTTFNIPLKKIIIACLQPSF